MTTAALHAPQSSRRPTGWAAASVFLFSMAPMLDANAAAARAVDAKALLSAADNRDDWLTHGRTYDEQRFSPLDRINTGNVKSLGLAWFADLDTAPSTSRPPGPK
jgi:glucose dehydrogenase